MLELTQADNAKSVEARPADLIIIHLPENPVTGFRWTVDRLDPLCVEASKTGFSPTPGAAVGAGGQRTLSFQVKGESGTGNIELKLSRAWEAGASIQQFGVTVKVRNT